MTYAFVKKQGGVALIEVLVSALVFAFGVVGLINLQSTLFKAATNAQARTVAVQLAEEKLEDLRRFADYATFAAIANNTGGTIPATAFGNSISINNTQYTRNWIVDNYYLQANGTVTTTDNSTPIVQKQIVITVAWLSVENLPTFLVNGVTVNQTVTLRALISSNSSVISSEMLFNEGGSGQTPIIPYRPSNDPNVTTIRVGDNKFRETMIPKVTTDNQGTIVTTQFTAYTYNANNQLLRQEDFKNVACVCAFNGNSQDAPGQRAYGPSYPVWDDTKASRTYNTYKDVIGGFVAGKPKGCVAGGGGNCAANPDPYCDICCRDHHDSGAATERKYAAFRSASDFVNADGSGNHKHYRGGEVVSSGTYVEACRLKRIDGIWRVYQDWFQISLKLIPAEDLNNSTKKTAYSDYTTTLVDAYIDAKKRPNDPGFTPNVTYPVILNRDSNTANHLPLAVSEIKKLSTRTVYLDWMDDNHLQNVYDLKNRVLQPGEPAHDYLIHIPFYEVDNTAVGNLSVPDIDRTFVRYGPSTGQGQQVALLPGEVQGLAPTNNPVFITSTMRRGNSGLVNLNTIVESADATPNSHRVGLCVGCTGGGTTGQSCTAPWGETVPHLGTVTGYLASTATVCDSRQVQCVNGALGDLGPYTNRSCTATSNTCPTSVLVKVNTGTSTATIYGYDQNNQLVSSACGAREKENLVCSLPSVLAGTTVYVVSDGVSSPQFTSCSPNLTWDFKKGTP